MQVTINDKDGLHLMSEYLDKMLIQLNENYSLAVNKLECDNKVGNLEATYLLGKVYYDGLYFTPNVKKVIALWEKGAQHDNLDCLRSLGDCYFYGFGYAENNEKAMELYSQTLKKNPDDYKALCQIGIMYGHGWGVKKDIPHAVTILKNAWKKGSGRAATEIGKLYMYCMDENTENIKNAIKWYQRGAQLGDNRGCFQMGMIYLWGDYGIPKSATIAYDYFIRSKDLSDSLSVLLTSVGCNIATPEEMKQLLSEAEYRATLGDIDLQETMGKIYALGLGVKADVNQASKWYLKAIENGNSYAEYQYGMKFALGSDGFEYNPQKAYTYLSHSAKLGQVNAMKELADLLEREEISEITKEEKDKQVVYWLEKAVENGDKWAALSLGRKFEKGCSIFSPNVEKAIYYYQIAADNEIEPAYLYLGKLYLMTGELTDYKKAYKYLSLAQENVKLDFQKADIYLCYGRMNKDGLGIPRNLEEAYKYFTLAASKGSSEAIEELRHFKKGLFGWKLI